jgi:hypothetical protein
MDAKFYTITQLCELLQKQLPTLVMARTLLPLCPARRDEYGRNLYGRRDVSLLHRYLIEGDSTALAESSAVARAEYLAAIAPEGVDRKAALEAEFARIVCGDVESTDEQETALLEALESLK